MDREGALSYLAAFDWIIEHRPNEASAPYLVNVVAFQCVASGRTLNDALLGAVERLKKRLIAEH